MEIINQPGETIANKYELIDTLGQGSSVTTYKAKNLQNGEIVAIKALSLHELNDWNNLELFEREVKFVSQLNHPAIPRYMEYFSVDTETDQSFYIVQQLARGKSLAAWLESGWRTDEAELRDIATKLLNILVYLQQLTPPVIHRDIQPKNIIRSENGELFLVDFGAVTNKYSTTLLRGSTVVGTYGYIAPEQFIGQAVPATDLYGLGATLLFLLTHRSPAKFPTDRLKIDLRSHVHISPPFVNWLDKMLEPDAEDRFSSAQQALDVLNGGKLIIIEPPQIHDSGDLTIFWQDLIKLILKVFGYPIILIFTLYLGSILPLNSSTQGICSAIYQRKILTVKIYLALGGNPNAKYFSTNDGNYQDITLLDCAYDAARDDRNYDKGHGDGNYDKGNYDDNDIVQLLKSYGAKYVDEEQL